MGEIASCPTCGYPVSVTHPGQVATCVNCQTKMQAVSNGGVTIPKWLLIGGICFAAGMFLGPALVASTQAGKAWLERQARGG